MSKPTQNNADIGLRKSVLFSSRIETFSYRLESTLKRISVQHALATIDKNGIISSVSKIFCEATGFVEGNLRGKKMHEILVGERTAPEDAALLQESIVKGSGSIRMVVNPKGSTGKPFLSLLQIVQLDANTRLFIMNEQKYDVVSESGPGQGPIKGSALFEMAKESARSTSGTSGSREEIDDFDQVIYSFTLSDAQQPDLPLIYCTPEFTELTQYDESEVVGTNCRFLQGPDTDRKAVDVLRSSLQRSEPVAVKLLNYRKDGSKFWNLVSITPMFEANEGAELRYFAGIQHHLVDTTSSSSTKEKEKLKEKEEEEDIEVVEIARVFQRDSVLSVNPPRVPISIQRPSITQRRQSTLTDDPDVKKATKLERISVALESAFESVFFKLGRFVADSPWYTIFMCLIVVGALGSGFSMLRTENRTDKLWVPQGTQTLLDRDKYEKYYGSELRINSFIAIPKSSGSNILTKPTLRSAIGLVNRITALTAYAEGATSGKKSKLSDFCVETSGDTCLILGILSNWDYNVTLLDQDTDIIATLNAKSTVDSLKSSLGFTKLDTAGTKVVSAESLKVTFFLNNSAVLIGGNLRDLPAEGWEKDFVNEVIKTQLSGSSSAIKAYPSAQRSFSDVFGGAIRGDVALLSSSIFLIIFYVMFNLGRFNLLQSGLLLSLGSVGSVGLAIVVSFGVASYAGQPFGPVHSTLYFILLGLGVDDALVLTSAFNRTSHLKDIKTRLSGVSITVTSLTDLAAFLFGTLTKLPALQSFCYFAAFGVAALYILQPTFFAACMVFDARRQAARRYDCLPCIEYKKGLKNENTDENEGDSTSKDKQRKSKGKVDADLENTADVSTVVPFSDSDVDDVPEKRTRSIASDGTALQLNDTGRIARFIRDKYAPTLLGNNWIRAVVIVLFLGFLGFGAFAFTQLKEDASLDAFIPQDSYFAKTKAIDKQYFGTSSITVDVVTESIDYFAKMQDYIDIKSQLNGTAYVKPTGGSGSDVFFQSWMESYLSWLKSPASGHNGELDLNNRPPTAVKFYLWLTEFFNSDSGGRFESDLVVTKSSSGNITTILAARLRVQLFPLPPTKEQVVAMDSLKNAIATKVKIPAFAFTFSFLFFEQYRIIGSELITNTLSTLGAVAVITLILIASPAISLMVFICVAATVADLAGIMYLWGLNLDSVAAVNLVLAVGLAVDYAAHIGHNFGIQQGLSRSQRSVMALGDIGAPVLNGGISTFLAVVLLSLSNSYVFQVFFKMFFATVVMGLFHGMVFLPVALSLFAPHGDINVPPGVYSASKPSRWATFAASIESKQATLTDHRRAHDGMDKAVAVNTSVPVRPIDTIDTDSDAQVEVDVDGVEMEAIQS